MLGRAVCFLGEFQSGEELYDTLTDQIGLTDDEIREIGFKSLAPFFNRDYYAQTIAEYLIDEGTDKTHSGNYHFSFAEVNERFGTSLPGDKEMIILRLKTNCSILPTGCQRRAGKSSTGI